MRSGENATKFGASGDPCKRAPTSSQTAVEALSSFLTSNEQYSRWMSMKMMTFMDPAME